jgi:Ca2+-transporting ATPase
MQHQASAGDEIRRGRSLKWENGLSEPEARARLQTDGYNELPLQGRRSLLRIALSILREPMLVLLLGGGLVYVLLGEPRDAAVLIAFATLSVVITVVQETRTERVLERLRDLTSPRALVIRDGTPRRVDGRNVVRGDVVLLAEGDRVPADGILIQCRDLEIDESLLTGESVPVRKERATSAASAEGLKPGSDSLPMAFSGTLVVRGAGLSQIIATGLRSEIGKIGLSLQHAQFEPPRLQTQTRRLVLFFAVAGGIVSLAAVLLYSATRGDWLEAALGGIALGMSMMPEEFPLVLTVFLAMGAWRISKARVLTRRAAAIESLGSATILCTDKTGTLTENRMSITAIQLRNGRVHRIVPASRGALPARFHDIVRYGKLASSELTFDPMEKAFHDLYHANSDSSEGVKATGWRLARTYGIRSDLLAVTHVWQRGHAGQKFTVAAKGAPEAIARLCRLEGKEAARLRAAADRLAAEGLRVLGVAKATSTKHRLPDSPFGFDFRFIGLAGLADPLRPAVPDAVKQCHAAGIRVLMVTGDYPATAMAIANQAGLDDATVLTGEEIDKLDDMELGIRTQNTTIYCRVMPDQKLRIVNALKVGGEIVAMTGDGVNDAPSLKAAHIGIAMGGRGTDVAREASSIVLLDDDFGSIVKAIRLGRRIYDNLRKAMVFIFAVHVPIAGIALAPLLFGMPVLLGPIHIAFLEMVIDPVCSLVFEAESEEKNIMARPPRAPAEPLFSLALIRWSIVQGSLAFALVAAVFLLAISQELPEQEVRALTFVSLVSTIFSLILVNRSFGSSFLGIFLRPNPLLALVFLAVTLILGVVLSWSSARDLFKFESLDVTDLLLALLAGLVLLGLLESIKPLWRSGLQTPDKQLAADT